MKTNYNILKQTSINERIFLNWTRREASNYSRYNRVFCVITSFRNSNLRSVST